MKKIEVRCRKNEILKFDQLYATMDEEYDVHINGSIIVATKDLKEYKTAKVYSNLCSGEGAILHVIENYKNYQLYEDSYYSYSMFGRDMSRFFDIDELAYIEVYATFNEETK